MRGRAVLVSLFALALLPARATPQVAVYEHEYPYGTPELSENHYIVIDSTGGRVRGWYYGTSDDFDAAREGYLPGFFVVEMEELEVTDQRIAFRLSTPEIFFTAPVPLAYRSASEVPSGSLEIWAIPVPAVARPYSGALSPGSVVLALDRDERAFRRVMRDR